MPCKISCMAIRKDVDGNGTNIRDWEIATDGKLWPCCYYANAWDDEWAKKEMFKNDPKLKELWDNNPGFNDLELNTSEDIIKHHIYANYINEDGWKSENPPALCVEECQQIFDENTNKVRSKAKIQITE